MNALIFEKTTTTKHSNWLQQPLQISAANFNNQKVYAARVLVVEPYEAQWQSRAGDDDGRAVKR